MKKPSYKQLKQDNKPILPPSNIKLKWWQMNTPSSHDERVLFNSRKSNNKK